MKFNFNLPGAGIGRAADCRIGREILLLPVSAAVVIGKDVLIIIDHRGGERGVKRDRSVNPRIAALLTGPGGK